MAVRRAFKPQRKLVFLSGEGASEQGYGRWLKREADRENVHVAITAEGLTGGDPLDLVQLSLAKLKRSRATGKIFRVRALLLDDDRFGEIPDRDNKALRLAEHSGLLLIRQRPCHEAFIVRHFTGYSSHHPPDSRTAFRLLKGVWPEYEKGMDAVGYEQKLTSEHLREARLVEPELDAFLNLMGWN